MLAGGCPPRARAPLGTGGLCCPGWSEGAVRGGRLPDEEEFVAAMGSPGLTEPHQSSCLGEISHCSLGSREVLRVGVK